MTSERIQRQIDRLLDEADEASVHQDWQTVRDRANSALAFDPENADARMYLETAQRAGSQPVDERAASSPAASIAPATPPTSFANGRYEVRRFLGEGGKKKVYLAYDSLLDRDVAFALIKTEGLDDVGKERITREAQAMGRLGDHPNIVTVYDIGTEAGQPYLVLPLLPGGDIEGMIEKAQEHRLPIEQVLKLGIETCQGLEFAHAKGIVHRDLKPGNVWLDEAGRAKIGDFGLAVAVDRSRLTQAGMMVGTVSYMPPEQAMGGEVTARSDLYSLGAMLYEMVCGRPPFVGDESVAIIGQHLNTPPVAPSWHRPDCPMGLEALILRMLEKDASKRPESASEVMGALASIATGPGPAPEPVASPHDHEPLYRRVFVGREQEVKQLQQTFDAAMSGQAGLVMVVGEPGIGKTSVVEQLATYVQLRGGKMLIGHCYEEGSLSLPYLPFIEAMRAYVLARDADGLRADLSSGASEVARIVSEVRDKVNVTPSDGGEPEEQRWRLMEAVRVFLQNASRVQALLLVLEDLHDADRGTIDMLLHLARHLSGTRLLLLGTYRDVEVDRAHPLSGALAELRRTQTFLRVPLRGLTVDEVHRLYAAVRGHDVSSAQSEAVHRQTEGNPLFIQELLRYLVEEGLVVRRDGRYEPIEGQSPGSNIPEGLRDVIGKRLSLLSDKTNQVLSTAAVIGREFRLDVLEMVAGLPGDDVIEALEQATERAVIEVRSSLAASISYRFTHAFFRQTLYEELSPPRRIRMHQQVAKALEQVYGRRADEHAAELAEHYAYSSTPADLARAVEFGFQAATLAKSVFAYAESVRHLERALEVQHVLDPDDRGRLCDLLIELIVVLVPAGDPMRATTEVADAAYRLAVELNDNERICRVLRLGLQHSRQMGNVQGDPRFEAWTEELDRRAPPASNHRVWADLFLSVQLRGAGRDWEAWQKEVPAFALARELRDDEALVEVTARISLGANTPLQDLHWRLEAAEVVLSRDFRGVRPAVLGYSLYNAALAFLSSGMRRKAEEVLDRLDALADRDRDPGIGVWAGTVRGLLATWDGRLEETLAIADEVARRVQEAGGTGITVTTRAKRRALFYLGRIDEALASIAAPRQFWLTGGALSAQRAIYLAYSGQMDEAREILDRFGSERDFGSMDDHTAATILRYLLEGAVAAEHRDLAAIMERLLAPLADSLFTEPEITNCVGRDLGDACVLLGLPDRARGYYEKGIEASKRGSMRPELALTNAHLAEVLLDHYPDNRDEAIEHLDFAIAEFRAMKMQPALERALGRRGLLKA